MDDFLQFFQNENMRPELRTVVVPFEALAKQMLAELPDNDQRTLALQRLLEAKDAAVRAKLLPHSVRTSADLHVKLDDELFTPEVLKALAVELLQFQRDGGAIKL